MRSGSPLHLGDEIRNRPQHCDQVVYQLGGIDHRCPPPRPRSSSSVLFISLSTCCAALSTAARFFGEKTTQGSIFWLTHASMRFLRVERPARVWFSLTVRSMKLRSISPVSVRFHRFLLPSRVFRMA